MRPPATAGAQFGDHPLAEEVDGPERVRPERWSEGEMRGSLFDERGAPVDDILGCAGDAEPEHGGRDEAERLRRVASVLGGRRRREVRSTQAHPLKQVRGELWPIKDELLRQGRSAPVPVVVDRDPDAGGDIDAPGRAVGLVAAVDDLSSSHGVVLGREKEGQDAVCQFAPEGEHSGAHGAEVNGYALGRRFKQSSVPTPVPGALDLGRRPPVQECPAGQQRLASSSHGLFLRHPRPLKKPGCSGGNPEHGPPVRELLEGGRVHGQFHGVFRVGVEHPGPEHEPLRRPGGGGQEHGRGPQEQVVGHPELVEAGCFGPDGQVDEGRHRDVVVEAEAYAQALWQCSSSRSLPAELPANPSTTKAMAEW